MSATFYCVDPSTMVGRFASCQEIKVITEIPLPEHCRPPGIVYAKDITPDMFYTVGAQNVTGTFKTWLIEILRAANDIEGGIKEYFASYNDKKALYKKIEEQNPGCRKIEESSEFDRYCILSKAFLVIQILAKDGWNVFVYNTWAACMSQLLYDIPIGFCSIRSIGDNKVLPQSLVDRFQEFQKMTHKNSWVSADKADDLIKYCNGGYQWISDVLPYIDKMKNIQDGDTEAFVRIAENIDNCMTEMGCKLDKTKNVYVMTKAGLAKQAQRKAFENRDKDNVEF